MRRAVLWMGWGVALLSGCSAMRPAPLPSSEPPPLPLPQVQPVEKRAGGVFQPGRSANLVADSRAFRAGDVITVVLMETTQASKKADTQLGKGSNNSLSLKGKNGGLDLSAGGSRDFTGSASSSQQNTLQGAITVVVQEVLANGLLKVQGDKSLYLNQGEELIRLGGYVRTADVDVDNRVSSQRIANARISYSGQGDLANANTPGWLTRWFVNPMAPL